MPDKIEISGVDRLPIKATREKTAEGYLKAIAAVTCVGVQDYSARDFGENSDRRVGVLRGADVVFHKDTIESARMKPVTEQHPQDDVTAKNHKDVSIGSLGENIQPIDGERLGGTIIINDEGAIKKIENGLVETSAGYDAVLIKESGNFQGKDYEYKFTGPMLINHLAVVDAGRCGPTVKILDKKKDKTMDKEELIKFLCDAGIVDKDGKALKDDKGDDENAAVSKIIDALPKIIESAVDAALEDAEDEEGEDDAEADEAKVQDAVAQRTKLITDALPLMDKDTKDGDVHKMSDREILEAATKETVGEGFADKSDDYLQAVLDGLIKDRKEAGDQYPVGGDKTQHLDAAISETGQGTPINGLQARKLIKKGE